MSGDCQSESLAEWLQSLGWRGVLQPSDLRALNTPKMRSIWRHLQDHVVPPQVANTVRKNVLLSRIAHENILPGQLRNFKLDSVSQLTKVKEILKIEEEKDTVREEIKMIDKKLHNELSSLMQKNNVIEQKRYKLSETQKKTTILEMKSAKLLKDCKQVDKETVAHLKCSKHSISHVERNHQKSMVCKYVKNYRYPFKDSDDDSEYLCEMMASILEFKPNIILDGIVQTAKEALISLNPKVDIPLGVEDKISNKKLGTFKEKLRKLKMLTVRKELLISECLAKIKSELNELQNEKEHILTVLAVDNVNNSDLEKESNKIGSVNNLEVPPCNFENPCKKTTIEEYFEDSSRQRNASQVVNDILERIQEESKKKKIWEERCRLMPDDEFEMMDNLYQSVIDLTAKEDELWKEVEKKVREINTVTSTIFNGLADLSELNELPAGTLELAVSFKTETSQSEQEDIGSSEFTNMILKEIEVFQGTPICALQRKWVTNNGLLRIGSSGNFIGNHSLHEFLLQPEEKNLIVSVLQKYLWSLYTCPQLH